MQCLLLPSLHCVWIQPVWLHLLNIPLCNLLLGSVSLTLLFLRKLAKQHSLLLHVARHWSLLLCRWAALLVVFCRVKRGITNLGRVPVTTSLLPSGTWDRSICRLLILRLILFTSFLFLFVTFIVQLLTLPSDKLDARKRGQIFALANSFDSKIKLI